jgi:hypothetical protein
LDYRAKNIENKVKNLGEYLFRSIFYTKKGALIWSTIKDNLNNCEMIIYDRKDSYFLPWEILIDPVKGNELSINAKSFYRSSAREYVEIKKKNKSK